MDIRPFKGWRYAGRDVTGLIAPPYDILSGADKEEFLARNPHNIVAVDMPHVPPKELGPEIEYQQAGRMLNNWRSAGVIIQDEKPCLYVYEQSFGWASDNHTRRAIICGVRATPFGQDVIPHEHTFAGPKADRLKLTECTKIQLSPIFGFYDDLNCQVAGTLDKLTAGRCDSFGHLRGVSEKLWRVDDRIVIDNIRAALRNVPVYIADGHHRYTTAMNYRDSLKAAGKIDDAHEANYVMFALVARDDPGMMILPTHRLVRNLGDEFTVERLKHKLTQFAWREVPVDEVDFEDAGAAMAKFGPGAMGFLGVAAATMWVGSLKDPSAMLAEAPDESDHWRKLDVAVLHKLIIDKTLKAWQTDRTTVDYTAFGNDVLQACNENQADLGVLLQSTPILAIQDVARAGGVMPHKSTYFYPKLSTGIVLKPFD
ncbi:MAG: DUF1015 domain-containing protein [Planctomycetes bacterium]|nr:DUF1015 domain-containing protein [Planctomycetota bacterium]